MIPGGYANIAPPDYPETRAAYSSPAPQWHKGAQTAKYRTIAPKPVKQPKPAPVSHIHYVTRRFSVK